MFFILALWERFGGTLRQNKPKRDLFGRAGATSNLKLWGNLKLWLDEPEVFGPDGFFRPTLQFDAVIIIYYRFGGKPIKLLGGHMDGRGGH